MFSEQEYQEIIKRVETDPNYLNFISVNMPSVYERYKKEKGNEKEKRQKTKDYTKSFRRKIQRR